MSYKLRQIEEAMVIVRMCGFVLAAACAFVAQAKDFPVRAKTGAAVQSAIDLAGASGGGRVSLVRDKSDSWEAD